VFLTFAPLTVRNRRNEKIGTEPATFSSFGKSCKVIFDNETQISEVNQEGHVALLLHSRLKNGSRNIS
jgi:hypothetical protein